MPWCPNCRLEYQEGFEVCSDCGCDLEEEISNEDEFLPIQYDHEEFLLSVSDVVEADLIEAQLKAKQIPVLRKFRGAGAYLNVYMGNTNQGIDLYVPSKLIHRAKEIIEAPEELQEMEVDSKNEFVVTDDISVEFLEEEKKSQRSRALRAWVLLIILFPGLLYLIVSIFRLFMVGFD